MPDAHQEVAGRETDILTALGIPWIPSRKHINCPFPDHADKRPSWRWDARKLAWFCTCIDSSGRSSGDIFAAVMRVNGCDFKEALRWCRELLHGTTKAQLTPKVNSKSMQNAQQPGKEGEPAQVHICAEVKPRPSQLVHKEFGKPSRIDPYHDPQGLIAELRVRYDFKDEDGEPSKAVLPWIWTGKRWINKQMAGPRYLYQLTVLLTDPEAPILLVEGEPAAEAATKLFDDYACTTTSGGCKAHAGTNYSHLKGRYVTIWPDNDDPGAAYAEAVAQHCRDAGAASIRIVEVPTDWKNAKGKAWDLADEVPSDSVDLREMLEGAPIWKPAEKAPDEWRELAGYTNGHDASAEPKTKPRPFPVSLYTGLKTILTNQWRIKNMLPARGLVVLYGAPGCGKSFLALDAALHIAAGLDWAQCRTKQGPVIYIAAEGQGGFQNRVVEAGKRLALPPETPFGLITVAPNLGSQKGDTRVLIAEIKAQCEAFGWLPYVIFVDTVSRAMYGAKEDEEGIGTFIMNCGLIAEAFNCLIVVVHHTGKDETRGMRGSSVLHGAADAELEVSNCDGKHTVTLPKMKDGVDGLSFDFDLIPVTIGLDEDGDPVTTCVVEVKGKPQQKPQHENVARPPLKGQQAEFFKAVQRAIDDAGEPMPGVGYTPQGVMGVRRHTLRKYAENMGFFEGCKAENAVRAMLSRHIGNLAGNRRLGQWSEWVWIP